jgi:hypothetical protein
VEVSVNKIVITALALSMLAGGPVLAKSVKVFSVVVAKGGNSAYASSSTSSSVSSNGASSYSATGTSSGPKGGVLLGAKSNGTWTFNGCYAPCTASLPP